MNRHFPAKGEDWYDGAATGSGSGSGSGAIAPAQSFEGDNWYIIEPWTDTVVESITFKEAVNSERYPHLVGNTLPKDKITFLPDFTQISFTSGTGRIIRK